MPAPRRLGSSDLFTPPLILGGNVFDWTADVPTSFAVLDAFVAGGGTTIDTADVYSAWVPGHQGGESEQVIGEWLRRRGRRDDVIITTKVGMLPIDGATGLGRSHVNAAIDASLRRLGTDYVDLYLAHADDPDQPQEEVAETFGALVTAGKVRAIGASNFTADRLAGALAAQAAGGHARYQVLQNHYNLLERTDYEGAVQELCVTHEIAMTPYCGLASGYLTGKYRNAADIAGVRAAVVGNYLQGNGPRVLAALDEIAAAHRATPAQVALAWLSARPGVAAPLASATSVAQLEELLGAMALTLDAGEIALLDTASQPSIRRPESV
jgi:aryl-alcohol dehydrogenase-like predicted oxidoreductase